MYQDPAQRHLASYLISLSKRCFKGAGWVMHLEYVAWDALSSGPRPLGWSSITAEDVQELRRARAAGAWVMYDEVTQETAVPLAQWPAVFEAARGRNRELLDG